ncbi:MAG: hypothetical protein ABR557_01055 [Pyrinomonadaceae bacterium]
MNANTTLKKVKRSIAIVLMLFTLAFAVELLAYAHRTGRPHRHRSFWKKHRDKLTVAGTTAAGAGIGGVAGGKKGALIGAGVGAGSGALYTYKIRKRPT